MTRVTMNLEGDGKALVQLLRRLLKVLGRTYGIRVKGITATEDDA